MTTTRPRGRAAACLQTVRDPSLRRLVIAYFCFMLIETITWTASLVFAYQQGGASEVGVAGALLLVPAIIVAPLASFCGDRFHRGRVLAVAYLVVGTMCLLTALTLWLHAPAWVVYVTASGAASAVTFPRPAMGALLPCITRSGDQLTSANVAVGIAQSVGVMAGPAAAATLLALGPVAGLFAAGAALGVLAAALVARVVIVATVAATDDIVGLDDVHHATMEGVRLLRRQRGPRLVVAVMGLTGATIGALDVAAVVVALDLLARPDDFAGVLGGALGVGAIAGAAGGVLFIGRRRLAPILLAAAVLQVAPLAGFLLPTGAGVALACFTLCGVGLSLAEVGGPTLLQASTPDDVMARVFGCLEGFRMASIAVGSIVCAILLDRFGVRTGLALFAAGVIALALLAAPGLLAVDRNRPVVDPDVVATLCRSAAFAGLPAFTIEQLAMTACRLEPQPGAVIIRHGEPGTTMYVVGRGAAHVHRAGGAVHTATECDYFGEVALLFDQPRNATVIAGESTVLYEIGRDAFLEAVTGHPRSLGRVRARGRERS